MLWLELIKKIGWIRICYIALLCSSLAYGWVVHRHSLKLEGELVISRANAEQQRIVLQSIASRTEQNEKQMEALNTQLEQQQKNNSVVVKKMLSVKKPSSCVEAMTYLKDNAATADWK